MGSTRKHVRKIDLPSSPQATFDLLVTPSAIREWWLVNRAIVSPKKGGFWAAAWGEEEDRPDYMSSCTIEVFDPPKRLLLGRYQYFAREQALPFEADFTTEFCIEPREEGCTLTVIQDGFPLDPITYVPCNSFNFSATLSAWPFD